MPLNATGLPDAFRNPKLGSAAATRVAKGGYEMGENMNL